jgi:hypothetical protein
MSYSLDSGLGGVFAFSSRLHLFLRKRRGEDRKISELI